MMLSFLISALHFWADPYCQPLCLYGSKCEYSFRYMRCNDSRVSYLGEWSVQGPDYVPTPEHEFTALWSIPYPPAFGRYPLETKKDH